MGIFYWKSFERTPLRVRNYFNKNIPIFPNKIIAISDVRWRSKEYDCTPKRSPAGKGDRGERWMRRAESVLHEITISLINYRLCVHTFSAKICYNNKKLFKKPRRAPEKTYLWGESAFNSHVGGEQHGRSWYHRTVFCTRRAGDQGDGGKIRKALPQHRV